jgi:hypothetical protein
MRFVKLAMLLASMARADVVISNDGSFGDSASVIESDDHRCPYSGVDSRVREYHSE